MKERDTFVPRVNESKQKEDVKRMSRAETKQNKYGGNTRIANRRFDHYDANCNKFSIFSVHRFQIDPIGLEN